MRVGLWLGAFVLWALVGWAVYTGQGRFETVAVALGVLLLSPVFFAMHHYVVKPRFRARHALEIHPGHLVWATPYGPVVIPRDGVVRVMGGDRLQWGGVMGRVELEVTPEYRIPALVGSPENPTLEQEFTNRQTEVSVSIALENWLREGP